MAIRPLSGNENIQSPFDYILPELKMDIVKRTASIMEESKKPYDESMVAKAKSDAARYLTNLSVVNQEFHSLAKQVARELPYVGMIATSMTIRGMNQDSQFREKIVGLIQSNKDIEVPFNHLSQANQRIALQELARPEVTQHLEVVKLDLRGVKLGLDRRQGSTQQEESVFQHLLSAIHVMSQHNNQFPNIELNLSHAKLGDQGVIALAGMLSKCNVRSLCLRSNDIRGSGGMALADALPQSTLAELDLSWNYEMNKDAVIALAKALPLSRLVSLNLNSNEIGGESAIAIAKALPDSPLTRLSLENNRFGNAGGVAIGSVLARSPLMHLDMSYNGIGYDGAVAIAQALSSFKLINLNLRGNTIGNAGAIAIFNELQQSCLRCLNLSVNEIGADRATVAVIVDALPLSKLEYLNISSNTLLYKRDIVQIIDAGRRGANPTIVE